MRKKRFYRFVIRNIQAYLHRYDKRPILTSAFGIVAALGSIILISWAHLMISEAFGAGPQIAAIATIPLMAFAFSVALVIFLLANEGLWRATGIYRFLRISGHPVRDTVGKLIGRSAEDG